MWERLSLHFSQQSLAESIHYCFQLVTDLQPRHHYDISRLIEFIDLQSFIFSERIFYSVILRTGLQGEHLRTKCKMMIDTKQKASQTVFSLNTQICLS